MQQSTSTMQQHHHQQHEKADASSSSFSLLRRGSGGRSSYVAAAGLLCFLVGTCVIYTTNHFNSSAVTNPNNSADSLLRPSHRALSELVRVDNGEDLCSYKRERLIAVKLAEHDVSPTYQASFPGSGARMTHELIRALTGIAISTDHAYAVETNRHRHSVAVKTHWPDPNGVPLDEFDEHFNGAVLVLRHPAKAIPSFFNFWYERIHHLANHSTRAPLEEWIKFRDTGLVQQLQYYQQHMEFWLRKYEENRGKLLVVTYEDLTDDVKGPETTSKIANFLSAAEGVQTVPPESISCVWQKVVKYEDIGITLKFGSHRKGPKGNPYTDIQLFAIKLMLQEQRIKFQNDPEMVEILNRYIDMMSEMEPELVTS